jgi:hypothetical protein
MGLRRPTGVPVDEEIANGGMLIIAGVVYGLVAFAINQFTSGMPSRPHWRSGCPLASSAWLTPSTAACWAGSPWSTAAPTRRACNGRILRLISPHDYPSGSLRRSLALQADGRD